MIIEDENFLRNKLEELHAFLKEHSLVLDIRPSAVFLGSWKHPLPHNSVMDLLIDNIKNEDSLYGFLVFKADEIYNGRSLLARNDIINKQFPTNDIITLLNSIESELSINELDSI